MVAQLVKKHLFGKNSEIQRHLMNWYPPFKAAGIKIVSVESDFSRIDVVMALRWYNRNYVGSHFGGSLCAMTDPFFMYMMMNRLGQNYIVWDKAVTCRYKKPGRGTVRASFRISDEEYEQIQAKAQKEGHFDWEGHVDIKDQSQDIVASFTKTLYVATKEAHAQRLAKRKKQNS